jgi:hypothetical protein
MFYGRGPRKATQNSVAEIIRFNESDIPGGGQVKQFMIDMTGANHDYDSLNNIVVKAGGRQVWNVNELQHAALIQRYTKKAGPGATATRFTIPFYLGAVPGMVLGFAPRAAAVEIDVDNTPSAVGDMGISYLIDETPTTHYPMYVQSQSNIAASATNGRYPVTQPGLLRGFCIARTTSITDIRVYVGNRAILDLTGAQLLESQELFQGSTTTLNEFVETPLVPIVSGETFIEVTTDGSWASTDVIAIMSIVPNDQ